MNDKEKAFDEALKVAEHELSLLYFNSTPENIYTLTKYANNPLLKSKIVSFIKSSFDILRKNAYDRKIAEDTRNNNSYESSVMVNHVVFGALARAAGMMGEKELAPLLYQEFLGLKGAYYELSLERGPLSIALSILDYAGAIDEILFFLDDAVSNEHYIIQNEEILEMLYAYCLLKKDKVRALEYMANDKRTKNLSLIAAALADLDVKEALPLLYDRLLQLDNPFTKEAFLEAIHRLETQQEVPAAKDRMVWLFGKRCSTARNLGYKSDNEFVLRAIEKTGNPEIEGLYESLY
ncbi:MAG: hypothetical protein K0R51_2840 [Cytophagaceae bacterium]|nr:hypothetical protein [Cytophagaceae bacterium]